MPSSARTSLQAQIPTRICHFWASKWPPFWAQVGQSGNHFGLLAPRNSQGWALGAHKPGKMTTSAFFAASFSPCEHLVASLLTASAGIAKRLQLDQTTLSQAQLVMITSRTEKEPWTPKAKQCSNSNCAQPRRASDSVCWP